MIPVEEEGLEPSESILQGSTVSYTTPVMFLDEIPTQVEELHHPVNAVMTSVTHSNVVPAVHFRNELSLAHVVKRAVLLSILTVCCQSSGAPAITAAEVAFSANGFVHLGSLECPSVRCSTDSCFLIGVRHWGTVAKQVPSCWPQARVTNHRRPCRSHATSSASALLLSGSRDGLA